MNNFSNKVTQIIGYSREEASRLNSAVVLPEHLLLALLRDDSADVNDIFMTFSVDREGLKQKVEEMAAAMPGSKVVTDDIKLSDMASNIMRLSVLEARRLHDTVIEPFHLLLAILHDSVGNGAKTALAGYDVTYGSIMHLLVDSHEDNVTESDNDAPTTSTHDDNPVDSAERMRASMDEDFDDVEDDDMLVNASGPQRSTREKRKTTKTATPALDKFSTDLTAAAAEGKLDPVVGRECEMKRVMEIICRRKKNNPVLIGEPGVGKSAIVEGLAQMIQRHDVSPILFNKRILALDMTAVVAGTKYRGQFEERIKMIINELEAADDIIIFIDEIHTIIGAGGAEGTMDAANILKPALARGTIQCIGATTLDEYRKSIEKDGALERRFQKVLVEPASEEETLLILNNIRPRYEQYHHVHYSDDAIKACISLTKRYITDRAFPDKAIDALDEVGARMHLASATVPNGIVDKEKEIDELKKLKKAAVVNQNFELAASYRDKQSAAEEELRQMRENWEDAASDNAIEVTADGVAEVVSMMSGVPVHRMADDENLRLRSMNATLMGKVIGQDKAIEKVVKAIQRNRLGLHSPNRPIGAFMFLGPTGVGKTYLAQQLATELFGSADALIRIDMSEYNESFNTSRLVGAPPGYVGYEEGGQLTERVRRHPYSIVLLDEIEKAHPNVYNVLLQVLDEGRMTDGNGRLVDFRNTIIIMTSNAGTRQLKDFGRGVGFQAGGNIGLEMNDRDREYARSIIQKALSKQFSPEFLNRLDEIITFDQLDLASIKKIIELEVKPLRKRVETLGYQLEITDEAMAQIADKGYDVQFGARPLKRALQTYVEDVVCEKILDGSVSIGDTIVIDKV